MQNAGKINREWYDACLKNGSHEDIESWFSEQQNADCEIDSELCVWICSEGEYQNGYWLSQERIDEICARIDAQ